jgi:hypothetical protein
VLAAAILNSVNAPHTALLVVAAMQYSLQHQPSLRDTAGFLQSPSLSLLTSIPTLHSLPRHTNTSVVFSAPNHAPHFRHSPLSLLSVVHVSSTTACARSCLATFLRWLLFFSPAYHHKSVAHCAGTFLQTCPFHHREHSPHQSCAHPPSRLLTHHCPGHAGRSQATTREEGLRVSSCLLRSVCGAAE